MCEKRLNIVEVEPLKNGQNKPKSSYAGGKARRMETQAYFDRLWLVDPDHFDPAHKCMELERLDRTLQLINEKLPLKDKTVADLGCGSGELSRKCAMQWRM